LHSTLPHIGLDFQGIVDPIDHIGQGNHHRQLNNFILGIIFSDVRQYVGVDRRCPAGNNIRKANSGFFFFVEGLAALVKPQRLNLFIGYADLLRRSSVEEGSVSAGVYAGCFQIGQLFVFGLYFALAHDRIVKLNECFEGRRKSGDDSENIGHFADIFLHHIVDFMQLTRRLIPGQRLWYSHWFSLLNRPNRNQ
jgi:hypothetical protein